MKFTCKFLVNLNFDIFFFDSLDRCIFSLFVDKSFYFIISVLKLLFCSSIIFLYFYIPFFGSAQIL